MNPWRNLQTNGPVYGSRPFPKSLLPQPHSAIQLKHVVALYEFFEDRLAESAAKHVHDAYRVGIPGEIAEEMKKAAPGSGQVDLDRSLLTALITALRRFIFRYLSSSEIRPESGDSLMERMQDTSLWPVYANKLCKSLKVESLSKLVSSTISKKLTIRNTYHVLCFYEDRLKVSTNIAIVTFVWPSKRNVKNANPNAKHLIGLSNKNKRSRIFIGRANTYVIFRWNFMKSDQHFALTSAEVQQCDFLSKRLCFNFAKQWPRKRNYELFSKIIRKSL